MSDAVFDELIHAPLRLQICAMLLPIQQLGFSDIRDSLGVSDSVLSKHLSTLAGAGYVEVSRVRSDARSRRRVSLTDLGRTAVRGHLAALQSIAALAAPAVVEDQARAAPGGGHRAGHTAAARPRIA
jgi:DNA-binding MarR family transcriptional regulator